MVIDSSALVGILNSEPDAAELGRALSEAPGALLSAATYLETAIVIDSRKDPLLSRRLDDLIVTAQIKVVPVSPAQAVIARAAYRDFGRGSGHAAKLNFGDCFSYALAKDLRLRLLFKGDDFGHTDIESAL